jgi:hypothetical protein
MSSKQTLFKINAQLASDQAANHCGNARSRRHIPSSSGHAKEPTGHKEVKVRPGNGERQSIFWLAAAIFSIAFARFLANRM